MLLLIEAAHPQYDRPASLLGKLRVTKLLVNKDPIYFTRPVHGIKGRIFEI
jgi:hypothetical protein